MQFEHATAPQLPLQVSQRLIRGQGQGQTLEGEALGLPVVVAGSPLQAELPAAPIKLDLHGMPFGIQPGVNPPGGGRGRGHQLQLAAGASLLAAAAHQSLETAAPGFPQGHGAGAWLLQPESQIGRQQVEGARHGALGIEMALQAGAHQGAEAAQGVMAQV